MFITGSARERQNVMRQNEPLSTRTIGANLLAFGLAHAAVDATSTGVLFAAGLMHGIPLDEFYYLVLLYNLLAFALQPLWGRVFDRVQVPRLFAVLGCLIVMASATMFDGWCLLAVFLAGTGNAMFHVGAGSICLNLTPNRDLGSGYLRCTWRAGTADRRHGREDGVFCAVALHHDSGNLLHWAYAREDTER